MSPSDVAGGQYGAVSSEHSHATTWVVNTRPYIVAVSRSRLWLIVSLHTANGWFEERPHVSTGGGEPYHISYGDMSPGLAVVAVQLRAWHAHDAAPAHSDG